MERQQVKCNPAGHSSYVKQDKWWRWNIKSRRWADSGVDIAVSVAQVLEPRNHPNWTAELTPSAPLKQDWPPSWYEQFVDWTQTEEVNQAKTSYRNSTRNRKITANRSTDSFMLKLDSTQFHRYTKPIDSEFNTAYLLTAYGRVLLEKLTGFAGKQEIPRIL